MAIETMRPSLRCGLSLPKANLGPRRQTQGSIRLPPRAARARPGRGWPASRPGAAGGFALGSQESRPEAAPSPGARTYPFYGVRQAGIVTPMQDRLHFAAFDVITDSRDELIGLLQDWTARRGADEPGPGRRRGRSDLRAVRRPAGRHRRGDRAAAVGADHHLRVRAVAVPVGRPGPVRAGGAAAGGAAAAAALPGRQARPRQVRRRPVRPGLRRRPAGRGARGAQPGPDRVRPGLGALVPARLRAYVLHLDQPEHAAEPDGVQGRHDEPQGRGAGAARRARLGAAGRGPQGRVAGRRHLPGRPADQHDHRDLGPAAAARAGAGDRADQGRGRAAVRRHRVQPARLRPDGAAATSR